MWLRPWPSYVNLHQRNAMTYTNLTDLVEKPLKEHLLTSGRIELVTTDLHPRAPPFFLVEKKFCDLMATPYPPTGLVSHTIQRHAQMRCLSHPLGCHYPRSGSTPRHTLKAWATLDQHIYNILFVDRWLCKCLHWDWDVDLWKPVIRFSSKGWKSTVFIPKHTTGFWNCKTTSFCVISSSSSPCCTEYERHLVGVSFIFGHCT